MTKVLLVGEHNPYGSAPGFELYPAPQRSAGYRLCCVILGYPRREYLETFDRCNLVVAPKWSAPAAREAATKLKHDRRVLLGAKVAAAHGVPFTPFEAVKGEGWRGVVLPHPSGRCRLWEEAGAYGRAREAVATLKPTSPACCEALLKERPNGIDGRDGERWTCPRCASIWVHVCDEAEGCGWYPA